MTAVISTPPRTDSESESTRSDHQEVSWVWIFASLLRELRIVLAFTLVGLLLGVGVALLRAPTYSSNFSFLPQSTQDPSKAGLASLAGQFGISVGALGGSAQPPELYSDLLRTREVLTPLARDSFVVDSERSARVPLPEILKVRGATPAILLDNTLRALRQRVISSSIAARTTGMVSVTVRTEYPLVSYEVAQRLLRGLNDFNLVTRQSQAREERRFTEARYQAARAVLRVAEDALQRFLQGNRQFGGSPQLTFERDRLQRDVSLQQQVVSTLAQQYEDARIREVRDTPVITVIEKPIPPARADPQMRFLILLLGTTAGFAVGVLFVLLRDGWRRERNVERDRAVAMVMSEWKRIRRVTA